MAFRLLLFDTFLLLATERNSLRAFFRYVRGFFCLPFNGRCKMSITSSLFSLAVFNIFRSVGKVISAGVQVASTSSLPLLLQTGDPGPPFLSSPGLSAEALMA